MEETKLSEFEELNRPKIDQHQVGFKIGKRSVPNDAPDRWGDDFALVAADVLPRMRPGPRLDYRAEVAYRFQKHDHEPPKRRKGKRYRTEAESRLDRAFTKVAEEYDKTEPTIREACTRPYEEDSPTEEFRQHCITIMDRLSSGQ
ncbi:hypothetical protein [Natrinema amylolyticum]|uniref:hypothetical protein n=1 Tax=Natrinema amylolyticum TaxID=2878679 RepID=UPI001CFAC619|nr:hypothetical protein [Natrinema amylolyticum]